LPHAAAEASQAAAPEATEAATAAPRRLTGMSTHRYEPTRKCRGRIGIVGAAVIAASRRICQNSTDSQKPVIRGLGERAGARDSAAAIVEPVARDALEPLRSAIKCVRE
jgi:hypothetical protein